MSRESVELEDLKNESFASSLAKAAFEAFSKPLPLGQSYKENVRAHFSSSTESALEVQRQIARIKPYLEWASTQENTGIDVESLNSGISFLQLIANGPSPVPMISIGNDGKASLFLEHEGKYLEADFSDERVEYLFSTTDVDYFDEDDVTVGKIPAKLLYFLYCHFAKNAAQ